MASDLKELTVRRGCEDSMHNDRDNISYTEAKYREDERTHYFQAQMSSEKSKSKKCFCKALGPGCVCGSLLPLFLFCPEWPPVHICPQLICAKQDSWESGCTS